MKTPRPGDEIWVQDYRCPDCKRMDAIGYATNLEILQNRECRNCGGTMVRWPPPDDPK